MIYEASTVPSQAKLGGLVTTRTKEQMLNDLAREKLILFLSKIGYCRYTFMVDPLKAARVENRLSAARIFFEQVD